MGPQRRIATYSEVLLALRLASDNILVALIPYSPLLRVPTLIGGMLYPNELEALVVQCLRGVLSNAARRDKRER